MEIKYTAFKIRFKMPYIDAKQDVKWHKDF